MNAVFPLSRRPVFGRMAVHIPAMQAFAFRLHRLWAAFSLRKLLDIDFGGLALPLLFPLNQADPLDRVQLCQQLTGFAVAAVQVLLDFIDGVIDKYPALFIQPAVSHGQAHAVKQQSIEQLCVRGQPLKLLACHKQAGDADKRIAFGLRAVEIVVVHVVFLSQKTK